MGNASDNLNTDAMAVLSQMFDAEMQFMQSDQDDFRGIEEIFHPEIVVHEPDSLPYAGDWKGYESLGRLFKAMHDAWSSMEVEDLRAVAGSNSIFMCCTLLATARSSGTQIRQPFSNVLKIENGFVIEGTPFYHDTAALLEALAGSP